MMLSSKLNNKIYMFDIFPANRTILNQNVLRNPRHIILWREIFPTDTIDLYNFVYAIIAHTN